MRGGQETGVRRRVAAQAQDREDEVHRGRDAPPGHRREEVRADVAGDVEIGRQLAVLGGLLVRLLVGHGEHGSARVGQVGQAARSFS